MGTLKNIKSYFESCFNDCLSNKLIKKVFLITFFIETKAFLMDSKSHCYQTKSKSTKPSNSEQIGRFRNKLSNTLNIEYR